MGRVLSWLSLRTQLVVLLLVPLIGMAVFAGLWANERLGDARSAEESLERIELIADLTDLLVMYQVQGRLSAARAESVELSEAAPVLDLRAEQLAIEVEQALAEMRPRAQEIAEASGWPRRRVDVLLNSFAGPRAQLEEAVKIMDDDASGFAIEQTFASYRRVGDQVGVLLDDIARRPRGSIDAPSLVTLSDLTSAILEETEVVLLAEASGEVDPSTAAMLRELAREQEVYLETFAALGLPGSGDGVEGLRDSPAWMEWEDIRDSVIASAARSGPGRTELESEGGLVAAALAAAARSDELEELRTESAAAFVENAREAADSARSTFVVALSLAAALVTVSLALGLWAIRPISKRLGALASRATEIGRGNLDVVPLEARGNDEIAILSRSFDEMSATLAAVSRQTHSLAEGRTDDPSLAEELPGHIGQDLQDSVVRLRQLNAQLAAREALARSVVEGAAEAIWLVDPRGRVSWGNEAAARLLGMPAVDMVGARVEELLALPWTGELRDASSVEAQARRLDGTRVPVLVSCREVPGDEGEPLTTVLARDISERKRFEIELEREAKHDALTGLPNRAHLQARVARVAAEARAGGPPFGLLFLDLDRFKNVNDALGHRVGDGLLASVAARLFEAAEDSDLVARLGGDEFVVLVENVASAEALTEKAELIQTALEAPFEVEGEDVHVSASVGIAMGDDATNDPAELLRNADMAMYRAKGDGPGQLARFDAQMQRHAEERAALERALRRALHERTVTVAYQPIISLADGRLRGAELLARWHHQGRIVPPAEFVPIAEETGMIGELGRLVLGAACGRLAEWQEDEELADLELSINVSGRQLVGGGLVEDVEEALALSGARADLLSLELTESYLLSGPQTAGAALRSIRELGVGVMIDDFGSGYSSLTYMRELHVDRVKIDRSFVSRLATDPLDRMIVSMVAAISRETGLEVVAEGVETRAQLDGAIEAGCHLAQGYYFARPMHLGDFLAWAGAHIRSSPLTR